MAFQGCKKEKEKEKTGSIYGIVTDKATSKPIKGAGMELKSLGNKTVTGNEEQFEFNNIEARNYQLYITKTEYTEFTSNSITVTAGQTTRVNVPIEKLPHALRVVNDSLKGINELDFGEQEDDITRSFIIFNDGPEDLFWKITKTAD